MLLDALSLVLLNLLSDAVEFHAIIRGGKDFGGEKSLKCSWKIPPMLLGAGFFINNDKNGPNNIMSSFIKLFR